MIRLTIDGLPVQLKAWHDLSWLAQYGRVFAVFDQLISGNLCLGLDDGNRKLLVKYAGAPTLMYAGRPDEAIARLAASAPRYDELAHPNLNQLLGQIAVPGGHALVFPWFPGFALAPMQLHLDHLHSLPLLARLAMLDSLMALLTDACEKDFLLAGLSPHHILIDFDRPKALLSSVAHFMRFPAHTPYPKLPGSSLFVPPEGYVVGTSLDETANVYALGALAFLFFDPDAQRKRATWQGPQALYEVATKGCATKPALRHQSARHYLAAWRDAVRQLPDLLG